MADDAKENEKTGSQAYFQYVENQFVIFSSSFGRITPRSRWTVRYPGQRFLLPVFVDDESRSGAG